MAVQVLGKLRADPRTSGLRVAILSNQDEPDVIERCIGLGAIAYLVKVRTTPPQLSTCVVRWAASPGVAWPWTVLA